MPHQSVSWVLNIFILTLILSSESQCVRNSLSDIERKRQGQAIPGYQGWNLLRRRPAGNTQFAVLS